MAVMELGQPKDDLDRVACLARILAYMGWPSCERQRREFNLAVGASIAGLAEQLKEVMGRPLAEQSVARAAARLGIAPNDALEIIRSKVNDPNEWRSFSDALGKDYPSPNSADEMLNVLSGMFESISSDILAIAYSRYVRPQGGLLGAALCPALPLLQDTFTKNTVAGITVSAILSVIARLSLTSRSSLNRALWLLQRWPENQRNIGVPFPFHGIPKSESELKKKWREYKTVSHLWIAMYQQIHAYAEERSLNISDQSIQWNVFQECVLGNLSAYLSVAKSWQEFLTSFSADYNQNSLVSPEKVWAVPDDFPGLDKCAQRWALPLPQEVVVYMASYQAPQHV